MNLRTLIQQELTRALEPFGPEAARYADLVRPTENEKFGDYQINCAMPVAKLVGGKPRDLAKQLADRLQLAEMSSPPEIAGPGFINLRLRTEWLGAQLGRLVADERMGIPFAVTPQTIVVDFSSPNVAKPMHVGHIRSTIIGDALARLLRFLGHRVVTDNHVGDWGTQFGMIILGYKRYGDERTLAADPVRELAKLYIRVNNECKAAEWDEHLAKIARLHGRGPEAEQAAATLVEEFARENGVLDDTSLAADRAGELARAEAELRRRMEAAKPIAEAARNETSKLHAGDPENRALWNRFMPFCLAALEPVYERLGVRFDHTLGESFYDPMLPSVVDDLLARGIARLSEGAVCVFRESAGEAAPCIVRKSDGAYTYATTDLATIRYRAETFQPSVVLYVVDKRQGLHFEQLFDAARRWGYDRVDFKHIAFGTIMGSDGRPFRTREGGTVGLEPLLDEAAQRARRVVDEKSPNLPDADRQTIAEAVGIGALKYADLSQHRTSDYVFSWDKMINLQGNTATYLQYQYARIQSIFREGAVDPATWRRNPPAVSVDQPAERSLGVLLLRFPEVLDQAAADYAPNLVASFLYNLAESFSGFYNTCRVLKAETEAQRASRLVLCDLTARALQLGLELLGIRTIDQM